MFTRVTIQEAMLTFRTEVCTKCKAALVEAPLQCKAKTMNRPDILWAILEDFNQCMASTQIHNHLKDHYHFKPIPLANKSFGSKPI